MRRNVDLPVRLMDCQVGPSSVDLLRLMISVAAIKKQSKDMFNCF